MGTGQDLGGLGELAVRSGKLDRGSEYDGIAVEMDQWLRERARDPEDLGSRRA